MVLIPILTVNQDVVQVDNDEFVQVGPKDVIHERHECRGGVGESERKDFELVEAIASSEGCLVDVVGIDANLVISGPKIDFAEDFGSVELIY